MAEDQRKLFVGQLPPDIQADEVRTIFATYGALADVHVVEGKVEGAMKCGFVTYETADSAQTAMQLLNDVYKFRHDSEKPIRVSVARARGRDGGGARDWAGDGGRQGGGSSGSRGSWEWDRDRDQGRGRDWRGGGGGGGGGEERDAGWKRSAGWEGGGAGGSASSSRDEDSRKVFCGQLPMDIREDEIRTIFNTYGKVTDVKIIDGKPPGTNMCAFVTYETEDAAKAAVQVLHDVYKFRVDSPKAIRVEMVRGGRGGAAGGGRREPADDRGASDGWAASRPSQGGRAEAGREEEGNKVFVACLPTDILEDEIRQIFGTYGEVTDVKIIDGKPPGTSKCAFVGYADKDNARTAIQLLSNVYKFRPESERAIRVEYTREKGDRGGYRADAGGGGGGGGHAYDRRDRGGDARGGDARGADHGGRGSSWSSGGGSGGDWSRDRGNDWSRDKGGDRGWNDRNSYNSGQARDDGEQELKLFVGQLPMDITEDEVKLVFAAYGSVQNVVVLDGKPVGTNKIAFVEYSKQEECDMAVRALTDNEYRFRPEQERAIRVSIAKPKSRDRAAGDDRGGWRDGGNDTRGGWKDSGADARGGWRDSGHESRGWRDSGNESRGWNSGGGGGGSSGRWESNRSYGDQRDRGDRYQERDSRAPYSRHGQADQGRSDRGSGDGAADRPPGPKLHIGNLPNDIQREDLEKVFSTYGKVSDVFVMYKHDGGQCAAFVTYEHVDEARRCMGAMEQGYEIRPGQGNINVTYAKVKDGSRDNRYRPY